MALIREATILADRDASLVARLKALATIVEVVSVEEVEMPDIVSDAIQDSTLISAAVAMKQTNAVCAALQLLGNRPELASTRKSIVRKLVAAGATGLNLAALAFQIGDLKPAATLVARDFVENIVPRLSAPDHVVGAWLAWVAARSDAELTAIVNQLSARGAQLELLYRHAVNPAHAERVRAVVRSILVS